MTLELSNFAARLRELISNRQSAIGNQQFSELALELFPLQFAYNAPYRRFCKARGVTPKAVEHWTQIPAVPTSAFKEVELSCIPPDERTAVFHSSGTTEQIPSRHFHCAESLAVYEASLWAWFAPHFQLATRNWQLAILTPAPEQAPHSSLVHMFETVRRKLAGASRSEFLGHIADDGSWTLNFEAALVTLNTSLVTNHPSLVLGTAFSFVHVLDFMLERNLKIKLPPGSHVMETGGYKNRSRTMTKTELHALTTERLGVPPSHIICEYGMSELSSQAYAVTNDTKTTYHSSLVTHHFQFPPWCRSQIISPETGREVADGETGLIRVFDLANVFSVMAIQTEDLAIRRGDGFELLGRAQLAEPRGCSLMTA